MPEPLNGYGCCQDSDISEGSLIKKFPANLTLMVSPQILLHKIQDG